MHANWIALFLDAIAAERSAAVNTLLAYRRDLETFGRFLARETKDYATATRTDIESYLAELSDQGLAASTRARHLSAIRQFYLFLFQENLRTDDPSAQISGPKKPKRLPATLTLDDVNCLLKVVRAAETTSARHSRDIAIIELLYATGMRITELVSLPMAATTGNPNMLLVRGKGRKERMVPLTPLAQAALRDWHAAREQLPGAKSSPFLFPARGKSGHLTRQTVFLLLKSLAAKAGIDPGRVSPHVIRHAFATHLLANGADLRAIQMLLGHADVATTEIYTHVLDEHLVDLVLNRHPLAEAPG